jgi:hypothetical protein
LPEVATICVRAHIARPLEYKTNRRDLLRNAISTKRQLCLGWVLLVHSKTSWCARANCPERARLRSICGDVFSETALMGRGAIRVGPMISAAVPLERGPEMFDRLYQREPNLTKVILNP